MAVYISFAGHNKIFGSITTEEKLTPMQVQKIIRE
jgi:hypothetical protein